jgi:hypothetical protein
VHAPCRLQLVVVSIPTMWTYSLTGNIPTPITASGFGRAAVLELARWLASALRRGVIRVLGIRYNFLFTLLSYNLFIRRVLVHETARTALHQI